MRISTTIGTNGGCFCLVSPTVSNDRAFAWYSTGTYAQSDVASFVVTGIDATSTAGVSVAKMGGLPFATGNLVDDTYRTAFRIVSVGVSGQYIGTPLNMAGQWVGYINPDGGNLNSNGGTAYNIPALSNLPGFKTASVTKSKFTLVTPALDLDGQAWFRPAEEYIANRTGTMCYPWAHATIQSGTSVGAAIQNGEAPILLMLTGGVPGQAVVFDVIIHVEMLSKTAYLTPSHSDEVAAKGIIDLAAKSNSSPSWHPSAPALMNGLASILQAGTRVVTTMGPPLVRQMGRLAITAAPLAIM